MTDFNEIANAVAEEITEPPKTPIGTWSGRISKGFYRENKVETAGSPIANAVFSINLLEPVEVSEALLDDFNVEEAEPVYYDIPIFDRRGNWNVKKFLTGLGLEPENGEMMDAWAARAKGHVVTFDIATRHNKKDPENPYVDVKNMIAG